jgi:predicted tellurium resistance membrane protein TerC
MRFLYIVWLIIVCGLMSLLICRRLIPVSETYEGASFFTIQNGKRVATPLLLVLAVVELSDVVFAVDSIPAVNAALQPFLPNKLCYVISLALA